MKLTSSQFRQNNTVLFKANLGFFIDSTITKAGGDYGLWEADHYIDTNQNGQVDISVSKERGVLRSAWQTKIEDPILVGGMESLRSSAKTADESEVITPDNSREHFIEDVTCHTKFTLGNYKGSSFERTNRRSLTQLSREILPSRPDAQWAVDLKTGEYMIFEPKTSE